MTLAVVLVLFAYAVPTFDRLIHQERQTAALNRLLGAVQFARSAALSHRDSIVLCPADTRAALETVECAARDQWHLGALIFLDRNGDGQRSRREAALRRIAGWPGSARVRWRSFRNRSYLRFRSRGTTDWQNGSFTWCPNEDAQDPQQVVLNLAGRARVARDKDGDGVPEDSRGDPIRCP